MNSATPEGTQLTERQASFLQLADEEGKNHQEIADIYGVSTRTVSSVLYFIRNRNLLVAGERHLTARQLEILCLVGAGLNTVEIGTALYLSRFTVENHLRLARERLGARNTAHCVTLAISQELLILDHDGQLLVPHAHRLAA